MRQNDLTFANFILHFGADKDLLDEAVEIVLPTFTTDTLIRRNGDTKLYFYEVAVRKIGVRDGLPELAITGHFVKEAVLRRQQIIQRGRLVEDYKEMETAPSAFFVITLTDHRLLYFAETAHAPSLDTFSSTIQIFMRRVWRDAIKKRHKEAGEGPNKKTHKTLLSETPMPTLDIIPMARQEAIGDSIRSFQTVNSIQFKLVRPNDEPSAKIIFGSVRDRLASLKAKRVDIDVSDSEGLEKEAAVDAVSEAAQDPSTEIIVRGVDEFGNTAKADNNSFALSVPVVDAPEADADLSARLYQELRQQEQNGAVHRPGITDKVRAAIAGILAVL